MYDSLRAGGDEIVTGKYGIDLYGDLYSTHAIGLECQLCNGASYVVCANEVFFVSHLQTSARYFQGEDCHTERYPHNFLSTAVVTQPCLLPPLLHRRHNIRKQCTFSVGLTAFERTREQNPPRGRAGTGLEGRKGLT